MGCKGNCHAKFSGGKQNGGSPEHVHSNPLINPDYRIPDWLAFKHIGFLKTTFCSDNLYLMHAHLVIMLHISINLYVETDVGPCISYLRVFLFPRRSIIALVCAQCCTMLSNVWLLLRAIRAKL